MAEKEGSEIMEAFRELVVNRGFRVDMHSEYCKMRKAGGKNCIGCESESGCDRYVLLGIVMLEPLAYKPTSYTDHEVMQKRIHEKIEVVLDKEKTVDEVRKELF